MQIAIRFVVRGVHRYPDAKLKQLRRKHPHDFGIVVKILENDAREIEWVQYKRNLMRDTQELFPVILTEAGKFVDFGDWSCERIAKEVAKVVARSYTRPTIIHVEEMDECCGVMCTFPQKEMEKLAKTPYYNDNTKRYVG